MRSLILIHDQSKVGAIALSSTITLFLKLPFTILFLNVHSPVMSDYFLYMIKNTVLNISNTYKHSIKY